MITTNKNGHMCNLTNTNNDQKEDTHNNERSTGRKRRNDGNTDRKNNKIRIVKFVFLISFIVAGLSFLVEFASMAFRKTS